MSTSAVSSSSSNKRKKFTDDGDEELFKPHFTDDDLDDLNDLPDVAERWLDTDFGFIFRRLPDGEVHLRCSTCNADATDDAFQCVHYDKLLAIFRAVELYKDVRKGSHEDSEEEDEDDEDEDEEDNDVDEDTHDNAAAAKKQKKQA